MHQTDRQHFHRAKRVPDLCAALDGKSILLSQTLPESSLLVCNEIIRSRAYILDENIFIWGNANEDVTNNGSNEGVVFRTSACIALTKKLYKAAVKAVDIEYETANAF